MKAVADSWAADYCAQYERTTGERCEVVQKGRGRYSVWTPGCESYCTYLRREIEVMTEILRARGDEPRYELTDADRALLDGK